MFLVLLLEKTSKKIIIFFFRNPIGEDFVSFGGAGFIHPAEITSEKGYGQGDIVKVQVDFRKNICPR